MRTIQDMIRQEVLCCMSSMVATIAAGEGNVKGRCELNPLVEQAASLCYPIPDYEEAAIQNGWRNYDGVWINKHDGDDGETYRDVEILCDQENIEPCDREVFEHWAVTDWFADKLEAAGEKVDKDFAGLCIWARTTTGQAIYADGVIERIYAQTHRSAA